MNRNEFDGWRNSPVGRWFFDTYLQGYADVSAADNGRSVGNLEATSFEDYAVHVKNAGIVEGVEYAINADPFIEEREGVSDEGEGRGAVPFG